MIPPNVYKGPEWQREKFETDTPLNPISTAQTFSTNFNQNFPTHSSDDFHPRPKHGTENP